MTTVEQVRERAMRQVRRSWMRYPFVYGGTLAITYLALGDGLARALTAGGAGLVVSAIIAFGASRRTRAGREPANLHLRRGLPRPERRAANRDIRRGEPSRDPILRTVEVADAGVIVRVYGWLALGAVAAAVFMWTIVGDDVARRGTRFAASVMLVVLVTAATWCAYSWFCARRFLRPPTPR